MSDFLGLDVAKDVMAEHPWPAKELLLRAGKRYATAEFKLHQMQGTDEIGELEQAVEAVPFKTDFAIRAFKLSYFGGYVNGLVMEHHADDVKTGFCIGETKIARFIHEYAQRFCVHAVSDKKREWRDTNPATHAESFPRIPVPPPQREKSARIMANGGIECKWGRK